ncbi:MAG: uncharacterized protein QG552_2210 [Thermodesulfobacteriota bacterium]|nr:uncharacterized protein [Thermodesulfobacteriota bacterium]
MMKRIGFRSVCSGWLLLCVVGVLLLGCTGTSGPATFYLLRSTEDASRGSISTVGGSKNISILVGPITLPDYLDRTQIVTVAGEHVMALDEFSRWAESLQEGFYRVLLEDLSSLLNTPEVYGHDRSGSISADYQVIIDVTRFDAVPGGNAVLTAFWSVSSKDGSVPSIRRKSVFRAPVSGAGFGGVVAAQNQTLTAFSREIAAVIKSLQR